MTLDLENYGKPPFSMAKSTISTGPFSIAMLDITRGYVLASEKSKVAGKSPRHQNSWDLWVLPLKQVSVLIRSHV